MRRFVCLTILLLFTVPFGVSVVGCAKQVTPSESSAACNGSTSTGQIPGQVANIQLSQSLATVGESLNYGQIGQSLSASAFDCTGASVSVSSFVYASSDLSIADINPANGQVCAGTWNRFTGGGVPDFTICSPPAAPNPTKFTAFITATAQGATSNVVPVFVHPVVTGVVLGNPVTTACNANTPDPSSNCCSFNAPLQTGVNPYDGSSCLSQGTLRSAHWTCLRQRHDYSGKQHHLQGWPTVVRGAGFEQSVYDRSFHGRHHGESARFDNHHCADC